MTETLTEILQKCFASIDSNLTKIRALVAEKSQ